MNRTVEATGKTLDDAINAALEQLGVDRDCVSVEVLENPYIRTAHEDRISDWERVLGIDPLPQGDDDLETWLSDRRETIIARLYQPERLNSQTISDIVKIFTGGKTNSYFKDGTIHILISPPKDNKKYKFENVEQELKQKAPAHLLFNVSRDYQAWAVIKTDHPTWADVLTDHTDWDEVLHPPLESLQRS